MKIIKTIILFFLLILLFSSCSTNTSNNTEIFSSIEIKEEDFFNNRLQESTSSVDSLFPSISTTQPFFEDSSISNVSSSTSSTTTVVESTTLPLPTELLSEISSSIQKPSSTTITSTTIQEKLTESTKTDYTFPITYKDDSSTITITKEWYKNAWCYAAHLKFTDYSRLGTACGNGYYGGYETTSHASNRLGAILTVNGCYSAPNLNYIVVRKGYIHNGSSRSCWVPAIYSSYTGKLINTWETGGVKDVAGKQVSSLVSEGTLTDTFNFGPPFLSNGYIQSYDNNSRAQRTFIGTNGNPGDIWIVVSDGRYNDGKSSGLTAQECASYLLSKGCTFGVPLDGGGSSTLVYKGKILNAVSEERAVVDFLYFK